MFFLILELFQKVKSKCSMCRIINTRYNIENFSATQEYKQTAPTKEEWQPIFFLNAVHIFLLIDNVDKSKVTFFLFVFFFYTLMWLFLCFFVACRQNDTSNIRKKNKKKLMIFNFQL